VYLCAFFLTLGIGLLDVWSQTLASKVSQRLTVIKAHLETQVCVRIKSYKLQITGSNRRKLKVHIFALNSLDRYSI
jgi:hypothetical protein